MKNNLVIIDQKIILKVSKHSEIIFLILQNPFQLQIQQQLFLNYLMKNYQEVSQAESPAHIYKQSPVISKSKFERQLDQRLQHLKERQTTTRKKLVKTTNEQTVQQPKYEDYNKNLMEQFSKISQVDRNTNKIEKTEIRPDIFDNLSQKMGQFLNKYFQNQQSIQIIQFIQASIIQFCLPKLKQQELQIAAKMLSKDLTTTDQNEISLNALQILLKKVQMRDYLVEKIYLAKYKHKKIELQKQCENILKNTESQQYNFKKREQSIKTKQYQLKKQIQQLVIKQKSLKQREKQLQRKEKNIIEREKLSKEIIKEKMEKMYQDYAKELDKIGQQVMHKMVNFEKNAKSKLNTIQKRITEVNKIKVLQFSAQEKQAQKEILKNKTIQDLQNKLKNIEKQAQKVRKNFEEQLVKLETENKQFLKASTILQNKQEKTLKKLEKSHQQIQAKQEENIALRMELNEIRAINQDLIAKNAQIQLHQQNIFEKSNKKPDKKKSVKKLPNSKKSMNNAENTQKIINFYDYLINLMISEDNQDLKNRNQAVLMQHFQQIYEKSCNLIQNSPQKIQQFNFVVSLIVKVGITKLNFLKYQQVNQILNDGSEKQKQVKKFMDSLICIREQQQIVMNLTKNLKHIPQNFQKNYCIYLSMGINSKNSLICQLPEKSLQQLISSSDEFLTFILEKYLSVYTHASQKQQLYLLDTILQLSNQQKVLHSLFLLHNYSYLLELMTTINLQKKLNNYQQQLIQKLLIILQRIAYKYNQQMIVSEKQFLWLQKCSQMHKIKQQSGLILANCQSILSNIQRNSQS